LDEPTVLAFVGGKLTSGEIDEHLADCRPCRDLVVLAARTTFAQGSPPKAVADTDSGPTAGVDRYTINGLLGAGGQALVYLAQDNVLRRSVALKILRDSRDVAVLDEARVAAKLSHPNLIAVHDAGAMRDGQLYLAMEHVRGGSLDVWLRTKRTRREILRVCVEAGRGLAAAHGAGVIHRDIKAANILVGDDGRARVTDFGLATLDHAKRVAGTPAYMAPEQLDGRASFASDQFSYAVTVWEALTGTMPFALRGDRAAAVVAGIIEPKEPLPRHVDRALRKALEPEPMRRWTSVHVLVRALEADPRRKWRYAGAAAFAVATAGTTTFALATRDSKPSCDDLPQSSLTWPARQRIDRTFSASTKPFAKATLKHVTEQLAAYDLAWTGAQQSACKATANGTQSSEMLDLRQQCLSEADGALRGVLDTLGSADDDVIQHALELVRGLPSLDACDDVAWLRERVRPPADRAARKAVADVAAQLAASSSELRSGKLKQALLTAETASLMATKIEHLPTRARAELVVGQAFAKQGETATAEQHLQAAAQLAQRGKDDRVSAEAWIELVKVIGHGNARYDEALRYAGFAEASATRLGEDRELRARLDYYRCAILDLQAKLDAADAACANAIKLRSEAFGDNALEVADVLVIQARVAHKRSKQPLAKQLIERATKIREMTLGTEHPGVMEALFASGQLANGRGALDEAEASFTRGMAIGRASLGEDSLVMAPFHAQMAAVLARRGRFEEALVSIDRSTAIREQIEGRDHPDLVFDYSTRGRILEALERDAEAVPAHERALQLAEKNLGDKHPSLSAILQDLGRLHARLGKLDVARGELDRAIVVATKTEEPAAIAAATAALAEMLHLANKPKDALPYYLQALATYEKLLGHDHPQLIATLSNIGAAYIDVRDPKAALEPLQRAIVLEVKLSGETSPQLQLPLSLLEEAQRKSADRLGAAATKQWLARLPAQN
jgi:tetratricopeptide (TPR) repeat protein/tRNA A-37 threonylcarbamoyl transferase component Bud32